MDFTLHKMIRNGIIILIVSLSIPQYVSPQVSFNYGPELGVSLSQLPRVHKKTVLTDDFSESTRPVISPVIGLSGQLKINKHFQFTVGIQYQMSGKRYHYHRDGRIPRTYSIPARYTFTLDKWEDQVFHKLSMPLNIGYIFNRSNVQPAIFIGYRPNLFLTTF